MTGARPGIHHDAWRQGHPIEARQQIVAHLGMQDGRSIEGLRGSVKGAAHPAGIERVRRNAIPRSVVRRGSILRGHTVAALISAACATIVGTAVSGRPAPGLPAAGSGMIFSRRNRL